MAIKVKVQRDFLRTEASVELPASVSQVDELLRATKTNGKMVVLYNNGYIQGINVEQNSKISESKSAEIRSMLGVSDATL
jgi:sulfur carrier protein ThiS